MEFSEFSVSRLESALPSSLPVSDDQSQIEQRRPVTLEQKSFAELAAEMYGLLAQPGNVTAQSLRPLLDLLPSGKSPATNEQARNDEAANQPALLAELLSRFGVNSSSSAAAEETDASPSAPRQEAAQASVSSGGSHSANNRVPLTLGAAEQSSAAAIKPEVAAALPGPSTTQPPAAAPSALGLTQVVESALRALSILRLKVSSVTSVARVDDGWRVSAELVERAGVPDTSDVLGLYEMRLDAAGNVLSYERTHMRRRCDLCR